MTVTWWTASGIILHHRSIAYELSIYCSSLIYFPVITTIATAIVTATISLLSLLPLPLLLSLLSKLSNYFATKYFATDIKFPGVAELTTQLLKLENILWLPLCRINKFGLNTLPSKTVAIPYTCGLSDIHRNRVISHKMISMKALGYLVPCLTNKRVCDSLN